jgi:syntaxin 8
MRNVQPKKLETKKSVRFNDTLEFSEESSQFKPYRDAVIQEPDEESSNALFQGRTDDGDTASIDSSSNQELFIQHQQQLLEQDTHLDALAHSVRRQHGLSLEINSELEDQNIMLEDLEAQIYSSDRRLNKGQKRLDYFTKKAKENGQWLTIIALIIILVLLLVIVK